MQHICRASYDFKFLFVPPALVDCGTSWSAVTQEMANFTPQYLGHFRTNSHAI